MDLVAIKRALVSVSDKTGIVELCRELADKDVEIISTGGTKRALEEAGIPVVAIDDVTGFPEMMDGRVKTLHPNVHGGLLADRSKTEHLAQAVEHGIDMIDLVVVNLYPFEATVAREDVTLEEAVEKIDIGGPSMLRSAAKNFAAVAVVTDPADYDAVLRDMDENDGCTSLELRRRLAEQVFRRTATYDSAIYSFLSGADTTPDELILHFSKVQDLRYGENPHQQAAFYAEPDAPEHTLARAQQLHGKELSYNNILDTDAALRMVAEFQDPACIIVKHSNPAGSAIAGDIVDAYKLALSCDPVSAFGSVIAVNRTVTKELADIMSELFIEVLVAPAYEADALKTLGERKNLRLLTVGEGRHPEPVMDFRKVDGGLLAQTSDHITEDRPDMKVVTKREPTHDEWEQLLFSWRIAMHTKSNAIVLVRDYAGVGIGAGQMSRVDAAEIAVKKAGDRVEGSVCASDAFMPFPDALEVVGKAGATALIQPGGSIRDELVIEAADELGIAMVFTGHRHFRH